MPCQSLALFSVYKPEKSRGDFLYEQGHIEWAILLSALPPTAQTLRKKSRERMWPPLPPLRHYQDKVVTAHAQSPP